MSEFDLYLPDKTLSYFKSLNWSSVKSGFGSNWKILAEIFARMKGKGIKNLFLLINLSNFWSISLQKNKKSIVVHELYTSKRHSGELEILWSRILEESIKENL